MEQHFTNGEINRNTHTPAEAVRLRAAGWKEVCPTEESEVDEVALSDTEPEADDRKTDDSPE